MQAAILLGYTQNKASAKVQGCGMKKRLHIRKEIDRRAELFREDIHVDIQDCLVFCIKVVGADIGDYLKFGAIDRLVYDDDGPVKDPDTGEYLKEAVNCITLGESEQLDTSVIQEVKQDTYAHVLPEMQAEVVKVLDGVFTKQVNTQKKIRPVTLLGVTGLVR